MSLFGMNTDRYLLNTRSVYAKLMFKKILLSWVTVVIKVGSWGMNHMYESPHNDKGTRMCVCGLMSTFRHGGASRSVFSRKQLRDCFRFEP